MRCEGSRDIIRQERSYWFSTLGQFFVGFWFFLELKKQFDITLLNGYHNLESITPSQTGASLLGKNTKIRKKSKRDKTKIGEGTSITVKVVEIDDKSRGGKRRRMSNDLVGCLSQISSILFLAKFLWLVPIFSLQIVNSS